MASPSPHIHWKSTSQQTAAASRSKLLETETSSELHPSLNAHTIIRFLCVRLKTDKTTVFTYCPWMPHWSIIGSNGIKADIFIYSWGFSLSPWSILFVCIKKKITKKTAIQSVFNKRVSTTTMKLHQHMRSVFLHRRGSHSGPNENISADHIYPEDSWSMKKFGAKREKKAAEERLVPTRAGLGLF